ncbi:PLP-dependent cysteine synthase family protein [Longimicrobium sp.]|uniref:PLP-dependent cysteine synthase family protein n=1 Tax=Longimicrobium sp. TaxID=2029185 RepID=UPI003B3A1D2E
MSGSVINANVVDALVLPRLVWLRPNLVGMVFTLSKLLPARYIVRKAREEGKLRPGAVIAETSSGTFGLSLAMVARLHGHPVELVSDPSIEPPLRRRLEDLGATVHIVSDPGPSGAFQIARLELLERILADNPDAFCPRQYTNPQNPASFAPCAEHLARAAGTVDCLVGPVGSGGSLCGTASALRGFSPGLSVVAVDTHHSVIFGLTEGRRTLRGLGNSLVPPNVDHAAVDLVHWVGAAQAYHATRRLHAEHAVFMGPTSGAAFLVADWHARTHPDSLTAVILPDEGYRYQDTVYDNAWLEEKGLRLDAPPAGPVEWDRPHDGTEPWAYYRWGRRTYAEVMGAPPERLELASL